MWESTNGFKKSKFNPNEYSSDKKDKVESNFLFNTSLISNKENETIENQTPLIEKEKFSFKRENVSRIVDD